jgi:hypothetical protein
MPKLFYGGKMIKKFTIVKVASGEASGSKTYGNKVNTKNKLRNKTNELQRDATSRLVSLIKYGQKSDRLARVEEEPNDQEIIQIKDVNDINKQPKIVQFAYHRGRLNDYRRELELLMKSGNKYKIELMKDTIEQQIKETEKIMKEIFDDIRRK